MKKEIKKELIERAVSGDAEAFAEIYFSLKDSIYGFAYRMTNNSAVAEEIAQEVFIFFIESPFKYRADQGSLFSFLCGVARNKILNYLKKAGTKLEMSNLNREDLENRTNGSGHSPLKNLLSREFEEKLIEGILALSHFQREAIILREMEEMSYSEIARVTETDINTTKARIYRARKNLAQHLTPYLNVEEEKYYEV